MELLSDEEIYFRDEEIIDCCSVCGQKIYSGDGDYFTDCDEEKCFCSIECVESFLDLEKNTDEDNFEPCQCPQCDSLLTHDYESVLLDGQRFCDILCAFIYSEIKNLEV